MVREFLDHWHSSVESRSLSHVSTTAGLCLVLAYLLETTMSSGDETRLMVEAIGEAKNATKQ